MALDMGELWLEIGGLINVIAWRTELHRRESRHAISIHPLFFQCVALRRDFFAGTGSWKLIFFAILIFSGISFLYVCLPLAFYLPCSWPIPSSLFVFLPNPQGLPLLFQSVHSWLVSIMQFTIFHLSFSHEKISTRFTRCHCGCHCGYRSLPWSRSPC